jgi:hypothetical protein
MPHGANLLISRPAGIWLVIVAALLGCQRTNSRDRYVPAVERARSALEQSLGGWKNGKTSAIEVSGVHVDFEDMRRQRGRRLLSYEMIGEVSGEDGRWFEVELNLDQPTESVRTRYIVIGINPLLVSRQEEFQNMVRWDHDMTPLDQSGKAKAP